MKHFSNLKFQGIELTPHSLVHTSYFFNSLLHFSLPLLRQWKLYRIGQFIQMPRAFLNLINLPQQTTGIPSLSLLRFLQDFLVESENRPSPDELLRNGEISVQASILARNCSDESPHCKEKDVIHCENSQI